MATNVARIPATPANDARVRADAQPASGASTSVKTSNSIAAVKVTAPARSKDRALWTIFGPAGTRKTPAMSVASATGTGRKKTQRQPISVRSWV